MPRYWASVVTTSPPTVLGVRLSEGCPTRNCPIGTPKARLPRITVCGMKNVERGPAPLLLLIRMGSSVSAKLIIPEPCRKYRIF